MGSHASGNSSLMRNPHLENVVKYRLCLNSYNALLWDFALCILGIDRLERNNFNWKSTWYSQSRMTSLYYRMVLPAIDIIPTSLAVAYSIGKYTNKKLMSHQVTYSPIPRQFFFPLAAIVDVQLDLAKISKREHSLRPTWSPGWPDDCL